MFEADGSKKPQLLDLSSENAEGESQDQVHEILQTEEGEPPFTYEQKLLALCLVISSFSCGLLYANVTSFLPVFAADKYEGHVTATQYSIIISLFNVGGVLGSPIHAITISKIGRKTSLGIGFIITIVCTAGMGAASFYPAKAYVPFVVLTSAFRLVQGYGDSLIIAVSYSIVNIYFQTGKTYLIGYMETMQGLGLICGPLIGSVVYAGFGYRNTYYCFAAVILFNLVLI